MVLIGKTIKTIARRPVYVTWTKGVSEWEAREVLAGVRDLMPLANRFQPSAINVFGSIGSAGPYGTADWYQREATRKIHGQQVDADRVMELIRIEPWRRAENHLDIMIFDQDFNAKFGKGYMNFVFGLGGSLGFVQSLFRFRQQIKDPATYRLVLRQIGRHEFGHVLGLVHSSFHKSRDTRGGIYSGHCTNTLCSMKQIMCVEDIVNISLRLRGRSNVLCPECIVEIKREWD